MHALVLFSGVWQFIYEAEAWYGIPDFNLLAQNISVPGLSPLFPDVHCTKNEEICQVVTGESGESCPEGSIKISQAETVTLSQDGAGRTALGVLS